MAIMQSEAQPLSAEGQSSDYELVVRAVEHVAQSWPSPPNALSAAQSLGLSPNQFANLLMRWGHLEFCLFAQALCTRHIRTMLGQLRNVPPDLRVSVPMWRDRFIQHPAMAPAIPGQRGKDMAMAYGFQPTPFGEAVVVLAPLGLAGLGFVDQQDRAHALDDMRRRWPHASFAQDQARIKMAAQGLFDLAGWPGGSPMPLALIGTAFELRVWDALLQIPLGQITTYGAIATQIGMPKASRAVGAAVGKNPCSFVVPCHRAVGSTGALTGYHWGLPRKRAMLAWEAGVSRQQAGMHK